MAERIEGLTIGLSLDTMKVDTGLQSLKSKMSLLSSEMKANMSAFDRGETSIKKYNTQIEGLNKRVEAQKIVTEAARKNHEKMTAEFGEGSRESEKAATNYNNQAASLNNLERYVGSVTDELKEFQKQQELQNSSMFKMGDSLTKFGGKLQIFSDKTKEIGSSLTKKLTLPALGAATALGAIVIGKGFQRLVGIDNARAKLSGLGHDAEEVKVIMNSALEAVKGTSYGMDEAATTAASAVAAGVEEGKELTRYLSLAGDAAAIAGVNLGDMGSILNKVKTSNKAYNGELRQLSDRGLPVYQWLAKEAGVAEDAVFDLAKGGQISSEMLMNAIENNIGGAAKEIGSNSFTAGIDNLWAAVGRLGASFLDAGGEGGGFFSKLKPMIADFTGRIDSMGKYAEKAGVKLGEMFTNFVDKVKSVKATYDNLSPTVQGFVKKIALIGSAVAVGIGPLLLGLGTIGGAIAKISLVIGPLMTKISGMGGMMTVLKTAFAAVTGPIGLTIAAVVLLTAGFILLYKKSETFRNAIHSIGDGIKSVFGKMREVIQPAIDSFNELFEAIKLKVGLFINTEGAQLMDAFKNIGNVISVVANAIWEVVKYAFDKIMAVINFVMPAVLIIIKSVWGNIKGVISGALDIIMGLVKTFSGLFTGDFSKMWEGVKQIFSGAITFVWNFIQLSFFGKILSGAKLFIAPFKSGFSAMWKAVTDIFTKAGTGISNFLKNTWDLISRTTTSTFNGISKFLNTIWTTILNFIKTIINNIFNGIKTVWTSISTTTSSIFNSIFNSIKTIFTNIFNNISTAVSNIFTKINTTWNSIKTTTTKAFGDVFNSIKTRFTDIVDAAKALPKRIGDGIGSMASKVTSGVTKVVNLLASTLGKGVNGVIGGINWVLGKIGVTTTIPTWTVPKYADGTGAHPGGLAYVGDGKGRNAGSELIQTPDGKYSMSPSKETLVNLPKGSKVLSALNTKALFGDIPQYASGIGSMASNAWDAVKGVGKKIVDTALDVFDYIKNPGKLLDVALSALGVSSPLGGNFVGDMAKGAFGKVKDGAIEFVKKKLADFGEQNGPGFKPPFRLTSRYGMRRNPVTGVWAMHNGDDYGAPVGTPIPNQAAGTVVQSGFQGIRGNYVRIKSGAMERIYQHNTRNLVSAGQLVRVGQAVGTVGSTGRSTGPHLHYEVLRNGMNINPQGFATGGLIKKPTLSMLAEEGHPEFVIPTDPKRRPDAMKLLALAAKSISSGGSSGAVRPSGMGGNGGVFGNMLNALVDQNQMMMEQNSLLMKLLQKNTDVYLDSEKVGSGVYDTVDRMHVNNHNSTSYMRGI